jgi:hypothetical protein
MAASIAMNNADICQAIMLNLGKGLELVAAFDLNQKKKESKSLDNQRYIAARRSKTRLAEWGKRVANIDGYRGVGGDFSRDNCKPLPQSSGDARYRSS